MHNIRKAMWGIAACLWLAPLAAMQFTDQINWGPGDFLAAAALLFGSCALIELAIRVTHDWAYRAGAALAVATAFMLAWANLAVGLIGSEDRPVNLLFWGALAVGIGAAALGRFQPRAMVRALLATAAAQAAAGLGALVAGWGSAVAPSSVFVGLWLASAWLFSRAAPPASGPAQPPKVNYG